MILNEDNSISPIFKKDEVNFNKFKKNYETDFIKYKTEERFTIPIIGMISSGKSTFLNSILQGNYLSISTNVDTCFVCILRNNYYNKEPKFYKCEIKKEKIDYKYNNCYYYHFEKKDEIKGNILDNIKQINEELIQYENKVPKNKRDINKYFYIMEQRIPLFDNNRELGNYFDLMDVPGLNGKDDFILNKIIPILVEKSLFSIFIFDILKFQGEDNLNVYEKYCSLLSHKNNSLYILNKIDQIYEEKNKFKDEKYYINMFLNILTKKKKFEDNKKTYYGEGFGVDLDKNFFLKLSALELFNKINIFSDFKTYISYIADKNKGKEEDDLFNFTEAIKEEITQSFEIDDNELEEILSDDNEKYNKSFDEEEYNEILNTIINKCFQTDLDEDDYNKLKYIFNTKKKKYFAVNEMNQIYEKLINCMYKSLDEFFDWNKVLNLMKTFIDSIEKMFGNDEKGQQYIELSNDLLMHFRKELADKSGLRNAKWDIKMAEDLKNIIDSLIVLDPNNKPLINLKDNFNSVTFFLYNNRRVRISLLGGHSTGKSSFLNCLIGKDILPKDLTSCTKKGIIIRHNKNDKSQLFNTKFIKVENPEFGIFKKNQNQFVKETKKSKKN